MKRVRNDLPSPQVSGVPVKSGNTAAAEKAIREQRSSSVGQPLGVSI